MSEISESTEKGEKKSRPKKHSTKIDMTPMVDLAFLLLTFFMLTNTFNKPQTMEINMPAKPKDNKMEQAVKESKAMTIILGEKNKIYWYMGITDPRLELTNFSKDGIRKILLEKNNEVKDLIVLIKPEDKTKYKNVVDILDEMQITNIARYALVDITPQDLDLIKTQFPE